MEIIDFFNNPNVGLFFYITEKFCVIPTITPEKVRKILIKELKVELIECNVYDTQVNNIFLVGNDEYLFVPEIVSPDEKKVLEKLGKKIITLKTKLNALGNNMFFFKKYAVINPNFEEGAIKQLEDLGFKIIKTTIAGADTVGANIVLFNDNALVNPDIKKEEVDVLEKIGLKITRGTVNRGNIVKSGVIHNKNGVIVSNSTMGPEMMVIEDLMNNG